MADVEMKVLGIFLEKAEILQAVSNEALGLAIKAMLTYATDEEDHADELPIEAKLVYMMLKLDFDKDKEKYRDIVDKRKEAGKRGNAKRWDNKEETKNDNKEIANVANATFATTNGNKDIANVAITSTSTSTSTSYIHPSNDVCISDSEPHTHTDKKTDFLAPSVEDVENYCCVIDKKMDAKAFVDHYRKNGWRLGNGNRMTDWRAAVKSWDENRFQRTGKIKTLHESQYMQRTYTNNDDAINKLMNGAIVV